MKRFLSLAIIVVLVFSMLAGCAASAQVSSENPTQTTATTGNSNESIATNEPITIRISWWGSQTRHEMTQAALELFKSKNPNVNFEMEYLSGPDYITKLATQAATGQMPDLFQTDYSWISQYVKKGLIADLNTYVQDGTIDFKNVSKNVVVMGQSDGKQYAVPFGLNTTSMFYDPAVFAKAGINGIDPKWTWTDYDKILTTVYNQTGVAALPLYYHIPESLTEISVRQQGLRLFAADGTSLGFDDPAVIQPMFQRILDLTKAGVYVSPDIWSTSKTTEDNGLVLGTASTAYGGSNQLVSYLKAANRDLSITSVPFNGDKSGAFVKPSMMLSVSETASEPIKAMSAKIINFLINDPDVAKIIKDERGVPVSTVTREIVRADASETSKKVVDYVQFIEENSLPGDGWAPERASEVYSVIVDLYMQVAFQKVTPENAAKTFMTKANEILAKNK